MTSSLAAPNGAAVSQTAADVQALRASAVASAVTSHLRMLAETRVSGDSTTRLHNLAQGMAYHTLTKRRTLEAMSDMQARQASVDIASGVVCSLLSPSGTAQVRTWAQEFGGRLFSQEERLTTLPGEPPLDRFGNPTGMLADIVRGYIFSATSYAVQHWLRTERRQTGKNVPLVAIDVGEQAAEGAFLIANLAASLGTSDAGMASPLADDTAVALVETAALRQWLSSLPDTSRLPLRTLAESVLAGLTDAEIYRVLRCRQWKFERLRADLRRRALCFLLDLNPSTDAEYISMVLALCGQAGNGTPAWSEVLALARQSAEEKRLASALLASLTGPAEK